MNRKYQDSVFTDLFNKPEYTLMLYQALYPNDTDITKEDIQNITLKNVLAVNPYNDVGFRVKDQLFVLVEAQSTWSENITLRCMGYFMQNANQYIQDNTLNIYAPKAISIPNPRFFVVYTGNEKHNEKVLKLSQVYGFDRIELVAEIVYDGSGNDIIHQYITFVKTVKEQLEECSTKDEAVMNALRICTDKGILTEYLRGHEAEVKNMLLGNIDEEFMQKAIRKSTLEEGIKIGEERGAERGAKQEKDRMILSMYTDNVDISLIVKYTECDEEYVKKVIDLNSCNK